MNSKPVILEGQMVLGSIKRMDNQEAGEAIGKMWEAFLKENKPLPYYSIYTNYESDHTGKYDYYLAVKADTLEKANFTIPAGNYLKIPVVPNNVEGVVKTWQEIWAQDDTLPRTYQADFEKYEANGEIAIYLSI